MLEDRVSVAVQGQRDSVALDQALHEKEVAAGVLLLVEQRVGHGVGGIIYGQQQGEPGSSLFQPRMMASVYLHQHPLMRHALASDTVSWRPTSTGTGYTGTH